MVGNAKSVLVALLLRFIGFGRYPSWKRSLWLCRPTRRGVGGQ
jgi:hypothetical protein